MQKQGDFRAFAQVADRIRSDIRSGVYSQGQQLPSGQDMAKAYGVAVNTLRSALKQLGEEGLVVTQHGRGSYVSEQLDLDQPDVENESVSLDDSEVYAQLVEINRRLASIESRLDELGR